MSEDRPPFPTEEWRDSPSCTMDLPGGNRVIRRVDFRFANLPGGGRAQLELWAR